MLVIGKGGGQEDEKRGALYAFHPGSVVGHEIPEGKVGG
jgi:hypothetical protein